MISRVTKDGTLYAIIISKDFSTTGIKFFTDPSSTQQLGYMNHAKGHVIKAHKHLEQQKIVLKSQEVLIVKSGKVSVSIFDNNNEPIITTTISQGDIILLCDGGHAFEWLEDGEVFEVKQGPYLAETDKVHFTPTT